MSEVKPPHDEQEEAEIPDPVSETAATHGKPLPPMVVIGFCAGGTVQTRRNFEAARLVRLPDSVSDEAAAALLLPTLASAQISHFPAPPAPNGPPFRN